MTNDELVERVARAICLTHGQDPDDYASLCDICGPNNEPLPQWHLYSEESRAAISTIYEEVHKPTEAMNVAGCEADDPLGALVDWRGENCTTRDAVSNVWSAMLTASPLNGGK